MKTPIMRIKEEPKKRGKGTKKTELYSYVVTYIREGEEMAIRFDGYPSRNDKAFQIGIERPGWRVKSIRKLYEEDYQ